MTRTRETGREKGLPTRHRLVRKQAAPADSKQLTGPRLLLFRGFRRHKIDKRIREWTSSIRAISHHTERRTLSALRHGIVTAAAPGMATRQPLDCQPAPLDRPVLPQRLDGILRTGRGKTARRRRERRYAILIDLHEQDQRKCRRTLTSAQQSATESFGRHVRSFYKVKSPARSRSTPDRRPPTSRSPQAAPC